jgi:transcriptional regulator with XRE-family HTH domain
MCLAEAIREERDRLDLSQEELGAMLHYSAKTVSAIENKRRRLPEEAKLKLAAMSPRLALEICGECPANIFSTDWLDGEVVDLSPLAVTAKLIEETEELLEALRGLARSLVNKNSPELLTEADRADLENALLEMMDLLLGGKVWTVKMALVYGNKVVDLRAVREKHRQKLIKSRYIRMRKKEKPQKAVR